MRISANTAPSAERVCRKVHFHYMEQLVAGVDSAAQNQFKGGRMASKAFGSASGGS